MANITFRLPGREQYSYAEVSVAHEEISGPDGPDFLAEILANSLAALNLTYPEAERPAAPAALQDARPAPAAPATGGQQCLHGERKHVKGKSAKGPWQGLFCPQPKGSNDSCSPVWLKTGEPGWQW